MKKFCLLLFIIFFAGEAFGAVTVTADNRKRSLEMAYHASMLLRDGRLEEALIEYNDADILSADESLHKIIDEIRIRITKEAEDKATADSLRRQSILHIQDGHLILAIEKLKESLIYYDNPDVRSELGMIEGRFKAESQKQRIAQEMLQIAELLENREEYDAALSKIEEARTVWNLSHILPIRQRIQKKIEKREADKLEALKLEDEANKLKIKANMEQDNDINLLQQALEKYRKSYSIAPASSVETAIIQTEHNILKISMDIKEAEKKAKEARLLEGQGKYETAIEVYNISLNLRENEEVANDLKALENKLNEELKREKQANDLYIEASKLEIDGKISEALITVNKALEISKKPEGEALKIRVEKAISEREQRRAKGAELAESARILRSQRLFAEALDMYWESWAAWPYSSDTKDAIDSLESIVKDTKTTEERAKRLYNEGLALEGEERLVEAIERITGSYALIPSKEVEERLSGIKAELSYKKWLEALLMQPLELKSDPVLPMIGQLVAVRIEGSSWLDSEKLTYKWELSDNTRDVKNIDGGKAVNFRASDETPVIIRLEIFTKEAKYSNKPIMEKKYSVIADGYDARINVVGMNIKHQKWNPVKKQLEPINELVTRSAILLRAICTPSVENAIYEWSLDSDTLTSGERGKSELNVRRNDPGLSKVGVIVKDLSGIVIGGADISFLIPFAYENVLIDFKKAEAWELWMESQKLWAEGKRLDAIKKASEASALDPSEPDITIGLAQLYSENAKIEESYYLSALSILRILEERYDDAILSLKESERLHPAETKRLRIRELEAETIRRQDKKALAERFRAEGDWLLSQQRKEEAISKYNESLLLLYNENLYIEVQRLTAEVEKENQEMNKLKELLQNSFSLVSKQRYSEALEMMSQALSLRNDEAIRVYSEIIKQKIAEEQQLKLRASKIRDEADSIFKDKKYEEAFELYHSSLEIWKDNDLEIWLAKEEQLYKGAKAVQLRKDAENFIKRKSREDAVRAYRESLLYEYNKVADDYVKAYDTEVAQKRAEELVREANTLLKQNKPDEALEKLKSALTYTPNDQKIINEIKKIEQMLKKILFEPSETTLSVDSQLEYASSNDDNEQLKYADKLFKEATDLQSQKKYKEALVKYKECYDITKNVRLKEFIDRFEKTIEDVEKANELIGIANELYKQGKFAEALKYYEESLKYYKSPQVEEFIKKLKTLLD